VLHGSALLTVLTRIPAVTSVCFGSDADISIATPKQVGARSSIGSNALLVTDHNLTNADSIPVRASIDDGVRARVQPPKLGCGANWSAALANDTRYKSEVNDASINGSLDRLACQGRIQKCWLHGDWPDATYVGLHRKNPPTRALNG